jgi:hypothetical protein
MTNYVGLDVSQKTTVLSVVDDGGHRLWRGGMHLIARSDFARGAAACRSGCKYWNRDWSHDAMFMSYAREVST